MFHLDFFGYMLIMIEDSIKEAGEGCGGQTELARSILAEKFFVSFPESLSEQERIVNFLDEASEKTKYLESIYQRKINALEEVKKSLFYQAFTGKL
jgi:type I restriction enzyme S subunit